MWFSTDHARVQIGFSKLRERIINNKLDVLFVLIDMGEIWKAQEQVILSVFSELGFETRSVEKDLRDNREEFWRVLIDGFDPDIVAPEYEGYIKGPDESRRTRDPMKGESITVCLARRNDEWHFLVNKSDINKIGVVFPNAHSHMGQWQIDMYAKHGAGAWKKMIEIIEDRIRYEHEMAMRDPKTHPLLINYTEVLREEYFPPRLPWERPDYITREKYLEMIGR